MFWRKAKANTGKEEVFADTIMKSRQQLNDRLLEWLPKPEVADLVFLVSHFPTTFDQMQQRLSDAAVEYRVETEALDAVWLDRNLSNARADQHASNSLVLCLSQQLERSLVNTNSQAMAKAVASFERRPKVAVLVAERHFLRQRDDAILDFFADCGIDRQLGYFVALDDPVLKVFGNQTLIALLDHYGLDDTSPIESPLVSKQVKHIQRRIARVAIGDSFVNSPEQWLATHCASLKTQS